YSPLAHPHLPSFPTRRSSDLGDGAPRANSLLRLSARVSRITAKHSHRRSRRVTGEGVGLEQLVSFLFKYRETIFAKSQFAFGARSEEHTSELQSLRHLVCRLL